MRTFRRVIVGMLMLGIIFATGNRSFAEDIRNPISITSTEVKEGRFTVNIKAAEQTDMQAFKYVLEYDAEKLTVTGGRVTGYGFYSGFLSSYNADSGAAVAYNNIVNGSNSYLIFTGAQANATLAKITLEARLVYIKFELTDAQADEESIAEALATIHLVVQHLEGRDGNLAAMYPDVFAIPLDVQPGDDVTGEDLKLGDANLDGVVNLFDAQMALRAALNIIALDGKSKLAADVNEDGNVTLVDAQLILKTALNIVTL